MYEWRISSLVPIHKNKRYTQTRTNCHGIKLMNHTMNCERILKQTFRHKTRVSENHFGFTPERSTGYIHAQEIIERFRKYKKKDVRLMIQKKTYNRIPTEII